MAGTTICSSPDIDLLLPGEKKVIRLSKAFFDRMPFEVKINLSKNTKTVCPFCHKGQIILTGTRSESKTSTGWCSGASKKVVTYDFTCSNSTCQGKFFISI